MTNGGKQAVYQAFQTLLDPGDEVLVPTPYWTTYPEAIKLADGVQVDVFAGSDQGYLVTVDQLEAARTERTKVLLFVSPSNPTGAVYSPEQTKAIGEWAEANGLWVITDEIYQNLVYDGVKAVSIVEAVPALADRTILVNGVAKTYAMTGWRVGWMVGPADAIKGAANLQSHLSSNVSNISQRAAIAALTGPQDTVEVMRQAFDRRRKTIVAELEQDPRHRHADARGRVLRLPRRLGPARPRVARRHADDLARARGPHPREGRSGRSAGRGLRAERVPRVSATPSVTSRCSRACSASSGCSRRPVAEAWTKRFDRGRRPGLRERRDSVRERLEPVEQPVEAPGELLRADVARHDVGTGRRQREVLGRHGGEVRAA